MKISINESMIDAIIEIVTEYSLINKLAMKEIAHYVLNSHLRQMRLKTCKKSFNISPHIYAF